MKRPDLFTELDSVFAPYKNKKVTVPHTAGITSNVLIIALHCAGAFVDSTHIEYPGLPSSTIERKIRELFIARLNDSSTLHPVSMIDITVSGNMVGATRYLNDQIGIMLHMQPLLSDTGSEACFIGMAAGDKSIAFISNMQKSWKYTQSILKNENTLPELLFPLQKYTQKDLVSYLKYLVRRHKLDHSLTSINWSCSTGSMFPFNCGECEGCKQSIFEDVVNQGIMFNLDRVFRNYMDIALFLGIDHPESMLTWSVDNDKKHPQLILRNNVGVQNGRVLMTVPRMGGYITEKPLDELDVSADQQWLYLLVGQVPHREVFKDAWGIVNVKKKIN